MYVAWGHLTRLSTSNERLFHKGNVALSLRDQTLFVYSSASPVFQSSSIYGQFTVFTNLCPFLATLNQLLTHPLTHYKLNGHIKCHLFADRTTGLLFSIECTCCSIHYNYNLVTIPASESEFKLFKWKLQWLYPYWAFSLLNSKRNVAEWRSAQQPLDQWNLDSLADIPIEIFY